MLSGLLRRFRRPAVPLADLATDGVVSIVGDVHGCDGHLAALLPQLPGQIVLVGDLVDRGDQVAAVIDRVMGWPGIICLAGNHEAMLLEFLAEPATGARWLRHGGLQTLASFGVGGDLSAAGLPALRDRLARAMGDARIEWLAGLPRFWLTGSLAVTHAGPDPARPIPEQDRTLQWGHPDCGRRERVDGLWVAHGHTIVPEATVGLGIIRVDTGAYAGGPLSAVVLGDGAPRVVVSRA